MLNIKKSAGRETVSADGNSFFVLFCRGIDAEPAHKPAVIIPLHGKGPHILLVFLFKGKDIPFALIGVSNGKIIANLRIILERTVMTAHSPSGQ